MDDKTKLVDEQPLTEQPEEKDPLEVTEEHLQKFFDNLGQQREKLREALESAVKGSLPSRKELVQMLIHTANIGWMLEQMLRSLFTDMLLISGQHGNIVQQFLKLTHAMAATQKVLLAKGVVTEDEMKVAAEELLKEEQEETQELLEQFKQEAVDQTEPVTETV